MTIRDDYDRLVELIEKTTEKIDLEGTLKLAVEFFEKMRQIYPSSPKEEREELLDMMTTLKAKLEEVSKIAAEKAGVDQDELQAIAQDPSNYTPEEWRLVQETKRKFYDSARKFSASMEKGKRVSQNSPEKRETKPLRAPTRRKSRKDWLKS